MTGQQLKNSILQMAIQGKLVPQDPHDEPASVLLDRIRAEKARLVKEGKLKKKDLEEKPISEEEIPFDVPEGWVWCRLGNIASFFNGDRSSNYPNKNEYVSNGIAWINTGHIEPNGYLTTSNMNYITEEKYNSLSSGKIQKGDLVYCLRGATYGKVAKVDPYEKGAVASSLMIIRPLNINIREYIYIYLKSSISKDQLQIFANGAAQPNLAAKDVSKFLLPLPPQSEQRRIVEKLETLMPLIERYGKSQEALDKLNAALPDQLRQSILQEAIRGRLVPQDPNEKPASALLERIRREKARLVQQGKLKKKDLEEKPISEEEIPFDVPEGWGWCRLGDICSFLSRGKSPNYLDTDKRYPVFAQKCNLKDGGISLDQARFLDPSSLKKWPEEYKLKTGDVLVNSTGTGTVGRTRLFNENCLGTYPFVVPDSHVSVVRSFDTIHSEYLYYLLNTKWIQTYFEDNLAGSTNQKELYIDVLGKTPVPLPPLAEQRRIVSKLEELLHEIDKLKG